jgi:hypothetical protein
MKTDSDASEYEKGGLFCSHSDDSMKEVAENL